MRESDAPLVTVAVPLYRSRPHVENIVGNIERLSSEAYEVLISDRHGADDAWDVLRTRFGGEPRVRFVRTLDGADWVEHYNALLRGSRARYFLWMPHDDEYPAAYVSTLVSALEAAPDALLGFGVMQSVDDGRGKSDGFEPPPLMDGEAWSPRVAARLLMTWSAGAAFRGVFRRDAIVGNHLFIERTPTLSRADIYWVFGVALLGSLLFVPETWCRKHYRADGASAGWPVTWATALDEYRVPARYLRRTPVPSGDLWRIRLALAAAAAIRLGWATGRHFGLGRHGAPRWGRRAFEGALSRWL
ncbi:MAG: glycosyltransferase family 2 protein [Vicinamibacterales bacterium]